MVKCLLRDSQSSSRNYDRVFMYSYIETAEAENTERASCTLQYVSNISKRNPIYAIHSHWDTHNMQDSYLNGIFAA